MIFFDHAGSLKQQDSFWQELEQFRKLCSSACVFLIGRPWDPIPVPHVKITAEATTAPELTAYFHLRNRNSAEIISLTAGIPALLFEYDPEMPLEANIRSVLRTDSEFYRLAPDWMNSCFRTPESYNTLLYGMAHGCHRISELAAFSGFPKNKCDKYIKTLIKHGLVQKEIGSNGCGRYLPANSYLYLWYRVLFSAIPDAGGWFSEKTRCEFMDCFRSE